MAEPDKRPVTMEELLVSSLAQTDALAKLLIEKGLITREEFMQKISEERATYQEATEPDTAMLQLIPLVIGPNALPAVERQVKFSRYPMAWNI